VFDAVQCRLDQQRTSHATKRQQSNSILMGRIFDAQGNRMTPTYAVKKGVRYRYYISGPLVQGHPEKAAKLNRIPAAEIEKLVAGVLRNQLTSNAQEKVSRDGCPAPSDAELLLNYVNRVDVQEDCLAAEVHDSAKTLTVPWKKTLSKRPRQIISSRVILGSSGR
jgi:hypothetical protein